MKRITWILVVSLLCSAFNAAEEVKWYEWNEAQELSETLDKPMMVFVYAQWCHMCKRMDTKVFTDEDVVALLNEHFIPVKFDAEFKGELKKDGKTYTSLELLAELTANQLRGIPSYLFISKTPDKKVRLEGGLKDPQEMKALLEEYE
jgi:uncharacterized protein YyaL (SSP411 family)